jgi:hypothetical protein
VTWTAGAFAAALVDAGDTKAARQVLDEVSSVGNLEGPAWRDWLLGAESVILLAEGDRGAALRRVDQLLRSVREQGSTKEIAAQVWWVGRVFGAEAAGGEQEVAGARELLESLHWQQALREPDLVRRR